MFTHLSLFDDLNQKSKIKHLNISNSNRSEFKLKLPGNDSQQFLLQQQMLTNQLIQQKILSYKSTRKVRGIKIANNDTDYYHKLLKKSGKVLQIPNFQRILAKNQNQKIILVNDQFKIQDIPKERRDKASIEDVQIELNYKNCENQEILQWFTNKKQGQEDFVSFPNSFETVGHMAHYNLTDQQEPFGKVIGEITLLKCPNIKTVVNKTEKLHNVYRTPTLQHMAGIHNYLVKLKEQGVQFEFDFEKVYWCSRLQQERDRLLSVMNKGELLADIFCGVGPLAVRAARKGLFIIANDLNPYCHEFLVANSKLNKVEDRIKCWNMCARQAMKKIYREKDTYEKQFQYPDHIYMNLPVDAIQFLDVLANYQQEMKTDKMPLAHVNCFVVANSDEKSKELLSERIKKVLPNFQVEDIEHMHHIKNVTVIMRMYCISIRLRGKPKNVQKVQEIAQEDQEFQTMRKKVKEF